MLAAPSTPPYLSIRRFMIKERQKSRETTVKLTHCMCTLTLRKLIKYSIINVILAAACSDSYRKRSAVRRARLLCILMLEHARMKQAKEEEEDHGYSQVLSHLKKKINLVWPQRLASQIEYNKKKQTTCIYWKKS